MKTKKIFLALSLIVSVGLLTQCEKYGGRGGGGTPEADPDSDRPAWAGGNTDDNIHSKGNDDSGTTRGGDYGDLYQLLRSLYADEVEDLLGSGVPIMLEIAGEYYVQPVGNDGLPLELNEEGELVDATQALEVEFGRLNIVRSPTSVLDQALVEALKVLDPDNGSATITQDFCGRLTSTYLDGAETIVKTIDSPRENMAIYRTIMQDLTDERLAFLNNTAEGEDPLDPLMVAASCFAGGSDKTGTVDLDEVVYINGFMNCTGNNPILNEWEFDFNQDNKYYYNFEEPVIYGDPYEYDREATYGNRYIQFLVWNDEYFPDDENGNSGGPVFSILNIMEGLDTWHGIGEKPEFTYEWGVASNTSVEGFAMAVDDAVQVLDFVHGDSNVRFMPDYTPQSD